MSQRAVNTLPCPFCVTADAEIHGLRGEIAALESKLAFLERHPKIAQGFRGEALVVETTGLSATTRNASFDIGGGSNRLEVKLSGLNSNERNGTVLRWHWGKVFGESGAKSYDYLILAGRKDDRFATAYKDGACGYVLFAVPYAEVAALATSGGGASANIRLSSNPARARGKSSPLFSLYQITEAELSQRYAV